MGIALTLHDVCDFCKAAYGSHVMLPPPFNMSSRIRGPDAQDGANLSGDLRTGTGKENADVPLATSPTKDPAFSIKAHRGSPGRQVFFERASARTARPMPVLNEATMAPSREELRLRVSKSFHVATPPSRDTRSAKRPRKSTEFYTPSFVRH